MGRGTAGWSRALSASHAILRLVTHTPGPSCVGSRDIWAQSMTSQCCQIAGARCPHRDGTMRLWSINTGAELRCLRRQSGRSRHCRMVAARYPAAKHCACGTSTLELSAPLRGNTGAISSVAVLPDGRRALSGGETLCLWDIETGAELRRFDASAEFVAALPDGRRALSASGRTLRLWDVNTGTELDHYVGDVDFTAIAPTDRGDRVVTGNTLGQLVSFEIPPASWVGSARLSP